MTLRTAVSCCLAIAALAVGPAPTAAAEPLTWAPPRLDDPTVVTVSASNRELKLDPRRDYLIQMPSRPLTVGGGLVVMGGRNVVLIGGDIRIPWQGRRPAPNSRRGLYLKEQTGTVHVEGLRLGGADISEGINLDQRLGAVVQLQNIRVDGVHARDQKGFTDNHPDVLQTWGGPAELRVDGLTGTSDYQGLFLHPQQFGGPRPRRFDLRNVDISGTGTSHYLLWQATPFRMATRDVWVSGERGRSWGQTVWPAPAAWPRARSGRPPLGSFVPRGVAGAGYRSPGYAGPR